MKTVAMLIALVVIGAVALGQIEPPPYQPPSFAQDFLRSTNAAEARDKLGVASTEQWVSNGIYPQVKIHLPITNFAVVGRQFMLNWSSIIESTVPVEQFEFKVACLIGRTITRGFMINALESESSEAQGNAYPLTVDVLWNGINVAHKFCWVRVASTNNGAGLERKIFIIGDSITYLNWTQYFTNLVQGDPLTMTLVGNRGPGSGNQFFALPGWSWDTYYTTTNSPFVFDGQFNFPLYLATNSVPVPDIVVFQLGINSCFKAQTDAEQLERNTNFLFCAKGMMDNISTNYPAIKFCFMPPNPFSAEADAWGNHYGPWYRPLRAIRDRFRYLEFNFANFDTSTYKPRGHMANSFGQINAAWDLEYAYLPVHSNSVELVRKSINPFHLGESGMRGMADALYGWVKNHY